MFQTYHASFYRVGYKSMWLSTIRTCLPALHLHAAGSVATRR